jgi:phage tail sheath protein FI
MPVQTTYPGVYIVEQPPGSHVISGVSTSKTAFVGAARMGPSDTPTAIGSYADFARQFGDPVDATTHPMGYGVMHFFNNGGSQAIIVRALGAGANAASLALGPTNGITITLTALSRGAWANGTGSGASQSGIFVEVDAATVNPNDRFTLVITNWAPGTGGGAATVLAKETWPELSMSPNNPRYVATVLGASALVTAEVTGTETANPVAGTSEGSVDLSTAITGLATRTLRVSVDHGPPVDYVLWPTGASTDSHALADIVTFINSVANGFTASASASGGKLILTSDTTEANSAVVVTPSGASDASTMLGLGVAAGGTEKSGSGPFAGTSQGSVDLSTAITGLPTRTLRVSVDQGPPVDYVLWPTGASTDSHALADIVTFINTIAHGFAASPSASGGKLILTSDTTGANSAVVVTPSGAGDASMMLGLGVAAGGTEISGSAGDRPADAAAVGLSGGTPGAEVGASDIVSSQEGRGHLALDTLMFPRFNLLCLPGVTTADVDAIPTALAYCKQNNAFLLVDPDPSVTAANALSQIAPFTREGQHGALYWPRLITPDSTSTGLPPSGAVAGVMAGTDAERGVWKAPAGLAAGIAGTTGVTAPTSDAVSGALNPYGINVLRSFPGVGLVVWGARTLAGSDALGDPFKYVPVRRLTDYIEASLYQGTQFAVFEPNDLVLWGQLRLAVTGFMRGLFRQGAFQQSKSQAESDSFFVTCDDTVNPQTEIDAGRVNIIVGFAPLKPAEFVVLTITQMTNPGA